MRPRKWEIAGGLLLVLFDAGKRIEEETVPRESGHWLAAYRGMR
jgi:hypothetical protein